MEIKVGDILYNDCLTVEVVSVSSRCRIKLLKTTNTGLTVGETYYMHYSDLRGMSKCVLSMDIE